MTPHLLAFLTDSYFDQNRWSDFAGYFTRRGYSCYAISLENHAVVPFAVLSPDHIEAQQPFSEVSDLLRQNSCLIASEATAAPALMLAQSHDALHALALLNPPRIVQLRLWLRPPVCATWIALGAASRLNLSWPTARQVKRHRFQGLHHISPQIRGRERVAYALRQWLENPSL